MALMVVRIPVLLPIRQRFSYRSRDFWRLSKMLTMSVDDDQAAHLESLLGRVRARLSVLEIAPAKASRDAGLSGDAIRNLIRAPKSGAGRKGVSTWTLVQLAKALRTSPGWLLEGVGEEERIVAPMQIPVKGEVGSSAASRPTGKVIPLALRRLVAEQEKRRQVASPLPLRRELTRLVPVMGEVAAGKWKEVLDEAASEPEEFLPIEVQGYERASLYALKVVGPSMNKYYPAGRYVVVAPVAEAGLRDGDHVIVERMQAGLVELTIKELLHVDGKIELWPRSSDPEFQEPLIIERNKHIAGDPRDQDAPRVVGVVVADYAKRSRPPTPFNPAAATEFAE